MPNLRVLLLLGFLARFFSPVLRLALRLHQPELGRFMRIDQLATESYGRGRWSEAEALALEGLGLAERYAGNWNYGNVIHNSHQILGLLHLREGEQEEAVKSLLAAGRSPGSPQLNSFGPKMVLATELLRRGERGPVLQYLDLVALFWTKKSAPYPEVGIANKRLIKQWKVEIMAGRLPQHKLWIADA